MATDTTLETAPADAQTDRIRIRGARVHNLKNIDIDLVRNKFIVITGPSGSGKSSLAFDTLYAEGQRQYVESLSIYARQYIEQMQRPDVDLIDGLPPTICIDQHVKQTNRRSTVATITEIYDYLRLLMARLGTPSCFKCGSEIRQQNPEQIQARLMDLPEGSKVMIMAPMVRGRKGSHREVFAKIRKAGFVRARVDGAVYDLDNVPELGTRKNHNIDAVIDRVIIRDGVRSRVGESIRLAIHHGEGLMMICYLTPEMHETNANKWANDLFSTRYACPDCNVSYEELETRTFSFNSPYGACPVCEGLGQVEEFDPELLIPNRELSLADGAVLPWKKPTAALLKRSQAGVKPFFKESGVDWETPLSALTEEQFATFLNGDDRDFVGLIMLMEKELATSTSQARQSTLNEFRAVLECRACEGSRLRPEARNVRFRDKGIHEITALSIDAASDFFGSIALDETELQIGTPLIDEIQKRIEFLRKVGLSYLTLDRPAETLSGGELQRVRLATSIGSGLVGVCYILDEPSIGLHPRDNQRLIDSLRELQQQGNTVLVVEHDEAMMRQADWLIDIGPQAGEAGGNVVSLGLPDDVAHDINSPTGRFLSGADVIPSAQNRRRITKKRSIELDGATANNLKNVSVRFPLGALVCVTGVSGSGKSTLVNETFAPALMRRLGTSNRKAGEHTGLRGVSQIDKVVQIDQSPIGRTGRSNPATFTGLFDEIRKVFAGTRESKQRGYGVGRFSFNVKGGRCEHCQGHGIQKIEMSFLPDIHVPCEECHGARFNMQTLRVKYKGHSIADVLDMRVDEAVGFFENFSNVSRLLETLQDVGLGYLPLGQASTTLSGGEAQRIKLATELSRVDTGKTLYLLDEPTTGLHFVDIQRLLNVLNRLVDKGNTVVVIEHNLDVIKSADWIIDLGPDGGQAGGTIVAEGTPEEVAQVAHSHTGQALREVLR
ncbi:MAG: excinuclease ABC subunit UvrA [Planctomycetales bacterium]|nr:excinuclease ABC subunit UvrA [Planctomycetales bacterium]